MGAEAVTSAGAVLGVERDGIVRYLGVPYADPPVRFAAPTPRTPWSGVRDCSAPGLTAPQPPRTFGPLDLSPVIGRGRLGEDYLTVDVWHPAAPSAEPRPVMVFLHGGAFVAGEPGAPAYDGTALASAGVVLVSVTYRLGIEGFLPVGDTNVGLRDQIAALHWVRDNAAAFGGDPANVTVFGESAGGMSVGCLLGSPLARGLFRRAAVQSGGAEMVHSLPVTAAFTERVAAMLGVAPTAEGFRSRSVAEALEVQARLVGPAIGDMREPDGLDPGFGLGAFCPVFGDDVLPGPPLTALTPDVDLLVGWNSEEFRLYTVPTGAVDVLTEEMAQAALGAVHPGAAALLAGEGSPGERYTAVLTDLVFHGPGRRLAAAHPGRTHAYEFAWRSPAFEGRLGACHALELPFVFGTLDSAPGMVGDAPPRELAAEMTAAWAAFARTGDPGWPEFPVLRRFDTPSADVV